MAVYDVSKTRGRTVVRKRHPILSFFLIAFAVLLMVGGIIRDPWLIIPTVALIGAGLWLKTKQAKNRT